jgi:SHS2 domain-containing protein
MSTSSFNEVEHTADVSLHIQAADFAELLSVAAYAMFTLMGMHTEKTSEHKRKIEVHGIDREDLLVTWLEELLFLMGTQKIGFGKIEIEALSSTSLTAYVKEFQGRVPSKEIKAVTYHGLEIKDIEGGVEVTIVFDV